MVNIINKNENLIWAKIKKILKKKKSFTYNKNSKNFSFNN